MTRAYSQDLRHRVIDAGALGVMPPRLAAAQRAAPARASRGNPEQYCQDAIAGTCRYCAQGWRSPIFLTDSTMNVL
jgi:hypothetical protein